jgi:sugar lactone lactonase YvrE
MTTAREVFKKAGKAMPSQSCALPEIESGASIRLLSRRVFPPGFALVLFLISLSGVAWAQTIATVAGGGAGDGVPAPFASLNGPAGVATDANGNVYIADQNNHRIRKVAAGNGVITTVAGSGTLGSSGDNGPATAARLNFPAGVAVDSGGNIYIADRDNHKIRKVVALTGTISTVAGTGTAGFAGDTLSATAAMLNGPTGVAVDGSGNVYFADTNNNRIRKVAGGVITTVAGNGTATFAGDNAAATLASLNGPTGIALDSSLNLYIADTYNFRLRKVTASNGTIGTVAGNGTPGLAGDNGSATLANLCGPSGVAVDANSNISISDTGNQRIRKVVAGVISTIAGSGPVSFSGSGCVTGGFSGDGGAATAAALDNPQGIALDANLNLYIADNHNNRIRKVTASNGIISTEAGTGSVTFGGDGGQATNAALSGPQGDALDASGNLYIADTGNNRIRKVDAATGIISTVAGGGTRAPAQADGGLATLASLAGPTGVATDASGNLFIADTGNLRVWKVDALTNVITTVSAALGDPLGVTVDGSGSLYMSDSSGTGSILSLTNGTIAVRFRGSLIANTVATPFGLAVDPLGAIQFADSQYNRVAKVLNGGALGGLATVAGGGTLAPAQADGGLATLASLIGPTGIALDAINRFLYIADKGNNRTRKVNTATGIISTVAGTGPGSFSGDGGLATAATLNSPTGVALDAGGNYIYVADTGNNRVRKFLVFQFAQAISFPPIVGQLSPGGTLPLAATGGASGSPVVFTSLTPAVCNTIGRNGASVFLFTTGACTIAANQASDAGGLYSAAAQVTQSFNVKLAQTIAFAPLANKLATDPLFTVSATGGASGNPVTFSTTTTLVCQTGGLNGASVVLSAAGICTINADQAGDALTYFAAARVSQSFSVTAAGAPGAPTISTATPGNTQAIVSFTPPASSGTSGISSYTVTCNPGGIAMSGPASPITVPGLTNGVTYACFVAATNASGPGPASASVNVTPAVPSAVTLVAVQSRKTHGASAFDLPIDATQPLSGPVIVEPRTIGAGHHIVFQFSAPVIVPGTASVTPIGTISTTVASGNEVIVTLAGIPDNTRVTVSLAGVNGLQNASASLGFLVGDVNNSRSVTATDILQVKGRSGQATDATNFKFDLNASGSITASDILAVKGRSGLVLPAALGVGGTISGLSGTVVLQDNGGNNLTLSTNGGFTFAGALVNGNPYNVTVLTQPAGQICTVTNGTGTITAASISNIAVACNSIPVAAAGVNQFVTTGSKVTLDGTASLDPDGSPLSYTWAIISKPAGSTLASLSFAGSSRPLFRPDVDGVYQFTLTVSDGQVNSAPANVSVTAASANSAPVANAGLDRQVKTGTPLVMDGTGSSDADGNPLSYSWTVTSIPAGAPQVALIAANTAAPFFTPEADGNYVLSLVVNDGSVNSAADSVTVTASGAAANAVPVANAGIDRHVPIGTLVTLSGAASSDADIADVLTYQWHLVSKPAASILAGVSSGTAVNPTVTVDAPGVYVFDLQVSDGKAFGNHDPVAITAYDQTIAGPAGLLNSLSTALTLSPGVAPGTVPGSGPGFSYTVHILGSALCLPAAPFAVPAASSTLPATIFGCTNTVPLPTFSSTTPFVVNDTIPKIYLAFTVDTVSLFGTISARGYIEGTNLAIVATVSSRNLEGTIYALDRIVSVNSSPGAIAIHLDNSTLDTFAALTSALTAQFQATLVNSIVSSTFTPILDADLLAARGWIFP